MKRSRQRVRRAKPPQHQHRQQARVTPFQQQSKSPEPHQILQMQRLYGNRHTLARIQREKDPKTDLQNGLYGLETMLYWGGTHAVLKVVPNKYRAGLVAMRKAMQKDQSDEKPSTSSAQKAVMNRYNEYGPMGMGIVMLFGEELVRRERLERHQQAIAAWRVAYPALQDMLRDCAAIGVSPTGTNSISSLQAQLRTMNTDLTQTMVNLSIEIGTELPDYVEVAETFFKAKAVTKKLESWMTKSSGYLAKANDLAKFRKVGTEDMTLPKGMMEGRQAGSLPPAPDTGGAAATKGADGGDWLETQQGSDPLKYEAAALTALTALKTATATPKAWSEALEKYRKGKKLEGSVGLAVVAKDVLSDIAVPVVKYGVAATERLIVARKWSNTVADIGMDAVLEGTNELAKMKAGLAAFEKGLSGFAGGIDLINGIIELSSGLGDNSYDSIVSGSISIAEGTLGLVDVAFGTSFGTLAAPFLVAARLMAHIVGETVKMYGALHVHDMKAALLDVSLRAKNAAEDTNAFMAAAHLHDSMADQGEMDAVQQELLNQYEKKATDKAASMARSTQRFVSSLLTGKLGEHEVMQQAFDQGVGGSGEGQRVLDALTTMADDTKELSDNPGDSSTEKLISMGNRLSEMMPGILSGLKHIGQAVRGIDQDIKTVDFFSPDQQHDSLVLVAEVSAGPKFWWLTDKFKVKSPINDNAYRQSVYGRFAGKKLDELPAIPITLVVHYPHTSATLEIFEGQRQDTQVIKDRNHRQLLFNAWRNIEPQSVYDTPDTAPEHLLEVTWDHFSQTTLPKDATVKKG